MSQIKYRAACDHCSATKIKCTQERPQCARCRALGRDCHYSRSLRAGKPPRSSQGLNRKLSNAPVLPIHNSVPELQVTAPKAEQAWSATAGAYPTPPAMVPNNGSDVFQFSEAHHGDSSSSSASPTAHPEWFFDFNQGSGMVAGLPMNASHGAPRGSISSPTTHASSLDQDTRAPGLDFGSSFDDFIHIPAPTPLPSGNDGDRCVRLATETLSSLYEMPAIQIDSTGAKQPSVDQALATAARAVQTMHDLVSCSCPKDFYLPMIVVLIASKIVAWYQAIAVIRDPYVELPEGKRCTNESVVDGPLTLGTYQLDDDVCWALRNQIVMGQLQRLNDIMARYQAVPSGDASSPTAHLPEGARLQASVGGHLRTRLQFTIQEIENRLRGNGGGQKSLVI
ncbi:Aflatoxin biosynthesis regulatory [Lecanosticta acicola]|uniref:Aflatoxin biosynthesis regulatory n=1 Tax=Lecanosticta acicola TaxID=111012 RepID=A0AAI8YYZ6_9PEZI|nr:Aflatoxin biosynthesis regulatory [Lecanosticta acicola]